MADNDFNIKITLDKNSVNQIKAEAERMSKQLQDINKQKTNQEQEDAKLLQRVRSRLLSQQVEEEKKAAKEKQRLLKEIKEAERLANKQSLEDAKVTARAKQRELERLFPKEKKGKSTFIGDIGSQTYFKEQIKGFTELRNGLSQTNPKWAEYNAKVIKRKVH